MPKKVIITVPKVKRRSHLPLLARQRNGGPMKDRRTPRGGAKNKTRDYLFKKDDM